MEETNKRYEVKINKHPAVHTETLAEAALLTIDYVCFGRDAISQVRKLGKTTIREDGNTITVVDTCFENPDYYISYQLHDDLSFNSGLGAQQRWEIVHEKDNK